MQSLDDRAVSSPPADTLEHWAWEYLVATDLARKFALDAPPRACERDAPSRRALRPGRDARLVITDHSPKTPSVEALRTPRRRAQLVHTFLHHEMQAAELMCWAILAFPDAPESFRAGLAAIARDEVRHMQMYADHLDRLGHRFGEFPVRDWFWHRVPSAQTPTQFVATLGMGFEGANLDHTARFAERFRAAGDEQGAAMQEHIGAEEIPHVRFAVRWFQRWTGADDFATWSAHLPPPLSPTVMRSAPIRREERLRSGFTDAFLDELTAWRATEYGP